MTRVVTLTGGVDSSWNLMNMINRVDSQYETIRPLYMDFKQGQDASFAEFVLGTEIAHRLLKQSQGYQSPLQWISPPDNFFPDVRVTQHHQLGARLSQQGYTILGISWVMNKVLSQSPGSTATVGWNMADTVEASGAQAEWSTEDYARLKRMYSDLIYFQDHGYRAAPLLTPAWDMDKFEMWSALPSNVKELITVASHYQINIRHIPGEEYFYIVADKERCGKALRYRRRGIRLTRAWRIKLDDEFYRRVYTGNFPADNLGGGPRKFLKELKTKRDPFSELVIGCDNASLDIRCYNDEEWPNIEHALELRWRAYNGQESEDLDAPTSEVASSRSEGDSGNQHNSEVRSEASGTDVGLPERVSEVRQGSAGAS
ncbi:hypothetical protein ASESINO_135 [Erwinia phage vB_EamM_Asesino]|uniref:Uncharacterized protein n=1 Tax=Erwinia phage vB_EamM_Asesino TaxID=1883370 RepID=A0A1B2IA47_9CAUD|nr:hypothetical protein ASESINO_135 [Erwinia phage vB_EamM_Asesino]ANZ48148.1 hypothetical protein ASESINO_135 [Erwinia phage vB_EamM_Asesino]